MYLVFSTKSLKSSKIFFSLSSFQILAMFRRGLFYSYLSIYLREYLHLSVTETTLFATLPMIMNTFLQMTVWGPISDKYQLRRSLIIFGELFAGIGTIVVFYAHLIPVNDLVLSGFIVIIGLSIIEVFWSSSNIGWSALISDFYPSKSRSVIQGQLSAVGGLGRVFGVLIGGLLYDGFPDLIYEGWGFREGSLFWIAALAMIISTIPMLFISEGGIKSNNNELINNSEDNHIEEGVLDIKIFSLFLIAMMFINFGRNSIATIVSQFLVLDSGFNVDSLTLSYIVNVQSVAIIIMGVTISIFINKVKGNQNALLLGSLFASFSLLMLAFTETLFFIYLVNFFRGATEVLINAASYGVASVLIPPEKRARLFSFFNATFFLSWGLAGTFFAGPVVDLLIANGYTTVFSYQVSFFLASILTFVGSLVFLGLMVYMRKKKE